MPAPSQFNMLTQLECKVRSLFMKFEYTYEQRQSAGRMEALMLVTGGIGAVAAVWVLFTSGRFASLALFLLSLIAFGLSRVFDLLGDVLGSISRVEESLKPSPSAKESHAS
jgi:hypothetical protein